MAAMFPVAGRTRAGYDRAQVEEFFARARSAYEGAREDDGRGDAGTLDEHDVRGASFDLVREGYVVEEVDAALDRLEGALVQRRREEFIAASGQQAWMDRVAERATTLYPRLVRPRGQRFAPPESGRGYDSGAVDDLLDSLVAYFDTGADLRAVTVRNATFPSAKGDRAYAEGPVDAFLDRAVEVLLAVE